MKKDNKKALYESILSSVAKEVKKALNEWEDDPYHKVSLEDAKEFAKKCVNVFIEYNLPLNVENYDKVSELLKLNADGYGEGRLDYLLDAFEKYSFNEFTKFCRNILTAIEYNKTGGWHPSKMEKLKI